MRQLTLQPEAIVEANEAFNWYEDRQTGLGIEFYRELTRCFEFVVENPLLARVVYKVTSTTVSVVSVFHGSRDPKVWKKRA